jgi:chaperonin GroEL
MPKEIIQDNVARQKLQSGIKQLANAVKSTLGPKGRNVMIENSFGSPRVTKDGVTVARHIDLEDKYENMGAQLLKSAANQAMDEAGDGTTTATVLAEAIVNAGLRVVEAGNSPTGIRDGITAAVQAVREELLSKAIPIKDISDIKKVATIAANGDEKVGDIIAKAIEDVGELGYIVVDKGKGSESSIENHKGLLIEKGYASPHFINIENSMSAILDKKPLIFVANERLYLPQHVVGVMNYAANRSKALVIISPSVEGIALNTMLVNNFQGKLSSLAINVPSFGDNTFEALKDIATVLGCRVFDTKTGSTFEELDMDPTIYLGTTNAEGYVRADKDRSVIVGGAGEPKLIEERAQAIRSQVATAPNEYAKDQLLKRASKLSGGISKIVVGGHSDAEVNELYDRIDDALCAARAASVHGILPGGGVALLKARHVLDNLKVDKTDAEIGVKIIARALTAPLYQIAENAGLNGSVVEMNILNPEQEEAKGVYEFGWDALRNEYKNMIEGGIIDPAKVTITALETAASVASLVLTTNVTIAEIQSEKDFSPTNKHNPR